MKKERRYIAWCDDGHDRFEFRYTSTHRNGSRANIDDLRTQYRRKHGKRNFRVLNTYLSLED